MNKRFKRSNICGMCRDRLLDPRNFSSHKLTKVWYPDKNPEDCMHIYCSDCVSSWLITCLKGGLPFTCPECRFECLDHNRLYHWYCLFRCFEEAAKRLEETGKMTKDQ